MEPEARYTLVGAAVLLLVGLLAAAIVWLLASGQGKDVRSYRIYFEHQSLEGLQLRSDVRMKGIRVGAVNSISFAADRKGAVEVLIGVEPRTPVRESTRAVVDRNLITGLATIRLVNENETSALLEGAHKGEDLPVIAEGSSQLQEFSDTVTRLAQNAEETLGRINQTLSEQNQAAITETLAQLRVLTKNANQLTTRLDGTLTHVSDAADGVRASSVVINREVARLADRYDTLGAETTTTLRTVSGSVQQMSADLGRLSTRTDTLLGDTDVELRLTGQQLRSAADALRVTARRFDDPRAVLFGPSQGSVGPGEEGRR